MPCLLVSPKQDSVLQMWSCNYWLVANNHVPCPSVYAYAKPTKTAQYEFGRLSHHVARQSHALDLLCTRTLTRFSAEQHPDSPSPARITTSDYSIPLQDFALAFIELHQVSTSPFPQPVEILLVAALAFEHIDLPPKLVLSGNWLRVHFTPLPKPMTRH